MEIKESEKILKALANQRRIEIIRFLKRRKFATVGEIADAIKLSFKATSKHLLILDKVDIVDRNQRSLFIYYRISSKQNALSSSILSLV